jgi:hypothetical protein
MARLAKRLVFSLVPATALLLAGLVVGEIWARAQHVTMDPDAGQSAPSEDGAACYRPSLTRGYEPIPGTCGRDRTGLVPFGGEPSDAARRVLVLGDSIADQRRWVNTMLAGLDRGLDQPVVGRNGGVPGYDSCGELRVLEEAGLAFEPELVVLQFCLNDYAVSATILPLPDGRVRFHAQQVHEFPGWVLRSRLLTMTLLRLGAAGVGRSPDRRIQADPAEHCIARMAQLGRDRGFELWVALFPYLHSDPDGIGATVPMDARDQPAAQVEARIRGFLDQQGIRYTDLRPVLEAHGPIQDQRNQARDPWHPDNRAQARIGAALAEDLLGAGVLD